MPGRLGEGQPRQDTTARADFKLQCSTNRVYCQEKSPKTLVGAAIGAIMSQAIPVFPCNPDKTPLTKNGFHDASTDPEKIGAWWTANPHALIGMPTGEPSGLWVLDIDSYKPGVSEAFAKIILENGELPKTKTQQTQHGGTHYFFKYRGKIKSRNGYLAKGIDVKAEGGYVCLYEEWDDTPAADAPEWLIHLATSDKTAKTPPQNPLNGNSTAYALKALEEECRIIRSTPPDTCRNEKANKAAFTLGQLVAGGCLSRSLVENSLYDAARAAGLTETEIPKTIKSGLDAGEQHPRTAPGRDTCDTTENIVSHGKTSIDNGLYTCDACDTTLEDKKTITLPDPPLESFHPSIQDAILNIAKCKRCPVEVPLSAFLALAAGLIGRSRQILIKKGWSEPGNLFLGLLATSGTGKGPGQTVVFNAVYKVEKISQAKYQKEMAEFEAEYMAWQKAKDPELPKPTPPHRKDIILDDWTIESTADSLLSNPKGVLLTRDELSGLFMDLDKYSGEKGSTKTKLMTAYDAKVPWKITRVNANRNGYIPNPCLSLYGGIQPAVACKIFSDQDQLSGFLGRFDFIQATQKEPPTFTSDEESETTIQTIEKLCYELDKLKLTPDGSSKYIGVSHEAKALFIKWHDELAFESWLSNDETETSLLSKVRARGLRICLILHCLESVLNEKSEMTAISHETMARALKLMDWLRLHTQATWQMLKQKACAPTGQEVRIAEAIINIQSSIKDGWLSTRDITEQANKGQDSRFFIPSDKVGRICIALGLEKKATRTARGFLITPENLLSLSNLLPSKHPSQVSQVSQANKEGLSDATLQKTMCHQCHTEEEENTDVEFF